jgi:uncharacterized OB-fold protein
MAQDRLEQGVAVWRCLDCGTEAFPLRLRCAACGSPRGEEAKVTGGTLADQTVVRRAVGGELPEPVRIGTIAADGGAVLVARLGAALEDGERVRLANDAGAPVASRADAQG